MQCCLKDATKKQANSESIRNWISEIREVAQDTEDAIEIYILKVENARSRGLLGKCASFPYHVYHLNKVGEEIESIRKRLEAIDRSRERYGIIQHLGEEVGSSSRSEQVERLRRLAPWEKDKDLVGVEKDVKLLLEKAILDEREGLSSATIVGMGGIGKSTLARKLYNHDLITARFDRRAWVVVSSDFRPREVIKELVLQLLKPSEDKLKMLEIMEKLDVHDLQRMLHERLQGTRYFIVVDDVWEDAHWEAIASAFPDEDKSSRLLLTSRKQVVTKYTRYVHPMKILDPDESWKLFLKKAFMEKTDGKCPQDLEIIGREILNKCNGLPLAISVIGGILVKQAPTKSGWEKVLKGINSHLGRSESNVLAILELSYQNLSPQLQSCFLCLGFFKEDAAIRAQKLIQIWIAQGLIPQEGEETMEEVARSYLDELINRNILQAKDMTKQNQIKNCQIHDLIRELSITKAREEIRFEILREESNSQSSYKPRHRVMYCSGGMFIDSTNQNTRIRSLFVHGAGGDVDVISPSSYWKSFELLKVLDFEGCRLRKFPNAIVRLTGLRYLGLSDTGIKRITRSLVKLKNLQVLDLRGLWLRDLNFICKMDSLRHVYVEPINMPLKISILKNLQTLWDVELRDSNFEQVLTQMTNIRKLGICVGKISNASKLFTLLAKLENLIRLHLWVEGLTMDGLGTLRHVTQLKLVDLTSRLPSASNFPPNLSYLTLDCACLNEDPMPILEKLPKLLYLKFYLTYAGERMIISHDGFPRLKVLILREVFYLENIDVQKGAMSELKLLEIDRCLDLQSLPEEVRAMSNLEELKMETTKEMVSKLQGVDSHIIQNIPSVHLTVCQED